MSFRKEIVQADVLQLTPTTPPPQGRSNAPTTGGLFFDAASNQFLGVVNGQTVPLGGAVVFAGTPTGTCQSNQIAVNSGTGALYSCSGGSWVQIGPTAGSLVSPITSPNPLAFDVNIAFKGPTPYTDVTRYGVRAVNQNVAPAIPGITATINSGTSSASISAASTFQNGDGVVIFGAGPTNTVATPTGLVVTPSVAAAGTGTGLVVNGPAGGATTYNYQIVARDQLGGLTAAGTVATTTIGAASLGAQSVAISGFTRSGTTVTATTSAPHGLSVGSMVYIFGNNNSDNLYFGGWYVVSTVPNTLHFTYVTGNDAAAGAPTVSNSTGTANWFNCNHLTWTSQPNAFEYYIYGRTGGSLSLLGVSRVQSTVNGLTPDTTWDDFGSPMMDGITLPYFVPNTPPVTVLADPLVTTIVSGAGTTTLVLANSAGTSVGGATILFDNTPNIKTAAALTQFGSLLYFPGSGTYVTNSYLVIPTFVSMQLAGATLWLNDTMVIQQGDKIFGMLGAQNASSLSFGWPVGAYITANRANPGIYMGNGASGDNYFYGIEFSDGSNGGNAICGDQLAQSSFNYINFSGGGSGYMDIPLIIRAADFLVSFDHIAFIVGPTQVNGSSATPAFMYEGGNIVLSNISLNRRGIFFVSPPAGANFAISGATREQGGITPIFTLANSTNDGGGITFNNVETDTSAHAIFANLSNGVWAGVVSFTGNAASGIPALGFGMVTGNPVRLVNGGNGQNTAVIASLSLLTFANLGTPANMTFVGCPDCTVANPCTGGGTGAFAKRLNGVWVCN